MGDDHHALALADARLSRLEVEPITAGELARLGRNDAAGRRRGDHAATRRYLADDDDIRARHPTAESQPLHRHWQWNRLYRRPWPGLPRQAQNMRFHDKRKTPMGIIPSGTPL